MVIAEQGTAAKKEVKLDLKKEFDSQVKIYSESGHRMGGIINNKISNSDSHNHRSIINLERDRHRQQDP
jgi:hypothetical protein